MKTRNLLVMSVGLNLLLVVGLVLATRSPLPEPAAGDQPATAGESTPRPAPLPSVGRSVSPEPSRFHWSQVESSDFQQYMANLRAIGCPEETIRDLILAEVNKLFAPRFGALAAQSAQYAHWKPGSKGTKLREQLQALQRERNDLLQALLGPGAHAQEQWINLSPETLKEQGRLAFLPPEKQQAVRELLAKYEALQNAASGQDGSTGPLRPISSGDDFKKLREQRRQELAQLLTPEELYQFDLRDSNTADSLRGRFSGSDLTEEEYRKLFDLRRAYEDSQGVVPDYSDPEKIRQRSEARRQLEEAYKAALGEDRFAEVMRQQDPSWRGLNQVAQQFNLPQSTIDQAYAYQRQVGEQMSQLFADPSVPSENRRAALRELNAEYDRALSALLGQEAYQEFKKASPQITFSTGSGDSFAISAGPAAFRSEGGPGLFIDRTVIRGPGEIRVETRVPPPAK